MFNRMTTLKKLSTRLRAVEEAHEWITAFELTTRPGDTLVVRPRNSVLDIDLLIKATRRLAEAQPLCCKHLCFDLSTVRELAGPWGVHFALFVHVGRQMGLKVSVRGLEGQPAALAWVFRHSLEVRELLREV